MILGVICFLARRYVPAKVRTCPAIVPASSVAIVSTHEVIAFVHIPHRKPTTATSAFEFASPEKLFVVIAVFHNIPSERSSRSTRCYLITCHLVLMKNSPSISLRAASASRLPAEQ